MDIFAQFKRTVRDQKRVGKLRELQKFWRSDSGMKRGNNGTAFEGVL